MGQAPQSDLIHDEWFGLAPLATPESLSEVSSISSRASHRHPAYKKKHASVTFVDVPITHDFVREGCKRNDSGSTKSWKSNLKQNFFSAENFVCVKSKTLSDSSPENGSLINESNDKFYSAESVSNDHPGDCGNKESEHLDDENTSESSPLLSSLHLLTDEKFQNLFKGNLAKDTDDSISSGSFKSVSSDVNDLSTSIDSVIVNAEVHRTEDSNLLEDIERSLNLQTSHELEKNSTKDTSVQIETLHENSENLTVSGGGKSKYMYPILSVGRGESSV
uniref:Uncharacterized protein n=2 Tax=Graphocephala atropunctata TaxID=36148 RepID=A0A1B6LLT7_9HEMI